jgi:Mg-chelatase subunit ChlD
MRRGVRRRPVGVNLILVAVIVGVAWLSRSRSTERAEAPAPDLERIERLDRELGTLPGELAEGIGAVVLMDVSGSMADPVRDGGVDRPKIDVARRAALAVIEQFARYAEAHPEEPVRVGLYEFSARRGEPAARPVIPLSSADPPAAKSALAGMRAAGGTPIGDALVAGKRALDASGLSRRHLLLVTDGENTDGRDPAEVMAALARRPERERPSVYFVAFDIKASRFDAVREAGGLVLGAADARELDATLGALLTGRILVEGP